MRSNHATLWVEKKVGGVFKNEKPRNPRVTMFFLFDGVLRWKSMRRNPPPLRGS
jgi:hypothetical protein